MKFSYLPALRGALALNRGEPSKAIDLLQAASPYELGYLSANSIGFGGSLYPIYIRGEAYLKARRGFEAVAEFKRYWITGGSFSPTLSERWLTCSWVGVCAGRRYS